MYIETALFGGCEYLGGQDQAVSHYHHGVSAQSGELLLLIEVAQGLRLVYRYARGLG